MRTPNIIVITYGQVGEKAGGLSRLSLSPLFVFLFVMHVPMIREIYAHVEAVYLRELMRSVGFILREHISPIAGF